MPKSFTLDDIKREITTALAATEKRIHDDNEPHFIAIQTDLGKIGNRLTIIERLLWQGERLDEAERRIIKLAELVGDASLATPFTNPIGN